MSAGVTRTLLLDQSYCQTLNTANDEEIRLFEQQFEKSLLIMSSCHHVSAQVLIILFIFRG